MKRIAFFSTTVAIVALARGALAGDPDDIAGLLSEPIVTTATKAPQAESTAPGTSTVLTAEDMRRYGIRTLAEAIDFLSLGAMTSHLQSPDVGVRGIAISAAPGDILVLIDGHAVNEPLQGSAEVGWGAGIPLELVDHVEMILGPGAVLYGTNAMLGVIHVVTKRAKDFAGVHVFADTSFVSDGRVGAGAGYEFTLFGSPSEITAAVQYFRQDGPNLTMPPENTGIDPLTGQPERYSRFGPPTGIWGGIASRTNNAEAPSALVRFTTGRLAVELHASSFSRGVPETPTSFDDPLNRHTERRLSLDAVYRIPVSNVIEVSVRGYADAFDRVDAYVDGLPECRDYCVVNSPAVARWAGTEVRATFDWFENDRFVTMVGAEVRVRSVAAKEDTLDGPTRVPVDSSSGAYSATDVPVAAYAQQSWRPLRWLFANGGARVDRDPRFAPVVSPRIALGVHPWESATLKGSFSSAFRAPSFDETNAPPANIIAAPQLVPETVTTWEVDFEQRLGANRLILGVFDEQWSNLVVLQTLTPSEARAAFAAGQLDEADDPAFQYRNVTSVHNTGANLGYEGSLGRRWKLGANLTGAHARLDGTADPLPIAPQFFGNARVSYDIGPRWPVVALAARYVGRRLTDGAYTSGFLPMPAVPPETELRATISGAVPGIHGLTFRTSASYTFALAQPDIVGPMQEPIGNQPVGLYPIVEHFRVLGGLQYDF